MISTVALGSRTIGRVVVVVDVEEVEVVEDGRTSACVDVVLDVVVVVEAVVVDVEEEVTAADVLVSDVVSVIPRSEFVAKSTPMMMTAAIIAYSVFMPVYLRFFHIKTQMWCSCLSRRFFRSSCVCSCMWRWTCPPPDSIRSMR